ncbi:MAG TPA: hypothetical protein VHE37_00800 [Nevskiaceae bacterium]|nr:hypothetical protein [Nevskiaceae bacterium]
MKSMLHSMRLVAGATVAAVAMAGTASAGDQDFTLVNKTGVEIHRMYTSPHSTTDWEEDVLGQGTLADGESLHVAFSPKEKAAKWDLKVEDADGNSITWENLNLMEISKITLHYDKGNATADLE